ncbi:hypothetical protein [Stigmatella aurantiaca]|uniref:Lipoprotein n=1 Tax=Stigmatella aurantiaca (strain DW4/3-1) TaxID=378806 RepID=Q08V43_STIAD|nr:hypothetical protein [Stigmatella aurantiaca]ADO72080.1 uncharacterized protein STAUR_4300 [Stigmatella aurantiaca DW4/3-1]EAU64355.1 hypothetical protein STIAU_6513 [Stigmatella aurantiaca DW4/3-1]
MHRPTRLGQKGRLSALLLAGTLLSVSGCSHDEAEPDDAASPPSSQVQAAEEDGTSSDLFKLPFVKPEDAAQASLQLLKEKTALGENVALHVKLPPPTNRKLEDSLVRVVGEPEKPLVLFRSKALAELGIISSSPGDEFFTAFSKFDTKEITRRLEDEKILASGQNGRTSETSILFDGRVPVGITKGISFDEGIFDGGNPHPVAFCPSAPVSTLQGWGESLFITSPSVVLDPARTWDPCTGAGTQGGVWTFAHLIRQMATGSGVTPEVFTLRWLEMWLNDYVVNGDTVLNRSTNMFNQVIKPWATASGATATLNTDGTGRRFVTLTGGTLKLNIAPFRLLAIVNRLDLGNTTTGPSGYGGRTVSRPTDAGELRFIFGIVQPNPWGAGSQATCGLKRATVIFEYGVPITGCSKVVQWAKDWTKLNTFGGFNASYLSHLQGLTQNVVLAGKAPSKGNQNAINQIRTNELPLGNQWELREFTLTDEDPIAGTDTPSNGLLRAHTVAQTPNDTAFPFTTSPTVSNYVLGPVASTLPLTLGPLPNNCSTTHNVPYTFTGLKFRGGNSLVPSTLTHWRATGASGSSAADVCARHEYSLNTCSGCHAGDTKTDFTHVSTAGIPATMSRFLTGTGPGLGWNVADTQFPGSATWRFADLERRWKRLYEVAFCTTCTTVSVGHPGFIDQIGEIGGVVPLDPLEPIKDPKFTIGPVTNMEHLKKILETRAAFEGPSEDVSTDFIRKSETFVH